MLSLPLLLIAIAAAQPSTPAHWAFRPVRPVAIPTSATRHPIDAFLGTKSGPIADKRTLIRRATFDLTGLPPTPEEIDAFLKDESPSAFAKLVDRLLASPAYGEKWGRLWLDLVRYADTAGETADFPAPEAFRYRNYVIEAFNADKPYDQFIREQFAGDILEARLAPGTDPKRHAELLTATGFLAISRRFGYDIEHDHFLTVEDTIDTLGKAVLGLTVACARCHDHKYDPISNKDYYALYGIFDSTRYPFPGCEKTKIARNAVPLLPRGEYERRMAELQGGVSASEKALAAAEGQVKALAIQPAAKLAAGDIPNGGREEFPADALRSVKVSKGQMLRLTILPKANNGADATLVELVVREQGGANRAWNLTHDLLADPYQNGTGFQHDDAHGHKAVWHLFEEGAAPRLLGEYLKDAEKTPGLHAWRGSEPYAIAFVNTNDKAIAFQTVRQPARSVALHPGARAPVAVAWESPIDGTVSVTGRVVDIDPSAGDGIAWTLILGPGFGRELAATVGGLRDLATARKALADFPPSVQWAYAVMEGKPHDVPIQKRGDPESPGEVVPRRFLTVLGGQRVKSPGAGSGRDDLAGWLTNATNPLTARVMVNRIWQGHFGTGLVPTPNDFGTRGVPPTHPELLDWLAGRFIDSGWSIKAMHRLLMSSDAYQRPEGMRRRLSAEEIRDSLLAVSGDLDRTPGGPHPFPDPKTWQFTQHSPFAAVYEHQKRSVYLMTQRIKRHPFLALFDGPDPNASTAKRFTTTVPTQSLFFLNDPFVHARSASLAKRLAALPDDAVRLRRACELLYARPPREDETAAMAHFLSGGGEWPGWLRVMLAANEFVYVD